ncbi:MAG: SDR family oxidoreductase [Bacteroidia bacterium]|nr:SDR family oxidoreductase [Bacteroidia bacterium]
MILDLFKLDNKVALVTGGTGVLGSEMVKALAQAGARVVILGRRLDAAEALARALQQQGYEALAVKADVLQRADLESAKEIIIRKFGTLDILVNAAGGNLPGAVITPDKNFFDLNMEDFDRVVDLNLRGTVLPTHVFAELMAAQRAGVIVNIASMSSFTPLTRIVGYSAAKAAVANFTQWLAVEMAMKFGEGIRVNALAPGFFVTEQNRALLTNEDGSLTFRGESIVRNTPYGRFGKVDELNGTLVWLCSDAAQFVTGVVVPVDGGFMAFAGV